MTQLSVLIARATRIKTIIRAVAVWTISSQLTRLSSKETEHLPDGGYVVHTGAQDQGGEQSQATLNTKPCIPESERDLSMAVDFARANGLNHHKFSATEAAANWALNCP